MSREREYGGLKLDWDNLRLQRMSEQDPPIMYESQLSSDNNVSPLKDPILMALTNMNSKLKGIERLEKKLAEVTSNFTEARNNDSAEINCL